jgi:hypothetical protein
MGNYWEPAESQAAPLQLFSSQTPRFDAPRPASRTHYATRSGTPIYSVSGSSGYSGEPPDDDDLPPADRSSGGPPGRDRQLDYYSDERYWTDYLRIGAPILGVLLIIALFYFWAQSWLGDDDGDDGQAGAEGTSTLSLITASPTASVRTGATGTAQIVVTNPPSGQTQTGGQGEPTPAAPTTGTGEIYAGATVQVANTGGTGANLRSDASTESEVVTVLLDGTELQTTADPVEAEGYVWWPVEGEAGAGWIVADYLVLVE